MTMGAFPSRARAFLAAAACSLMAGCFEPVRMCDCALELNIRMRIRDGADSACVPGADIRDNGAVSPEAPYDSSHCEYRFHSGSGTRSFVIARTGYDTLALKPMTIRYRDDDCCGNLDDKTIDILWYKSGTGRAPVVEVR